MQNTCLLGQIIILVGAATRIARNGASRLLTCLFLLVRSVLSFWRTNEVCLPKINTVARAISGIPATTAKSESASSMPGCLLQRGRAAIEPMRAVHSR